MKKGRGRRKKNKNEISARVRAISTVEEEEITYLLSSEGGGSIREENEKAAGFCDRRRRKIEGRGGVWTACEGVSAGRTALNK